MGTMRPDKYDGTKAYRVCHEFIPPDDCINKSKRSNTTSNKAPKMVLIAGALCSGRGSEVILQSRCSRKFLRIENDGKVVTTNIYQNLTITPDSGSHVKLDLRLIIYSKQANRYLCFRENNWNLVGLERIPENGRHRCQFYEQAEGGYSTYVSVINKTRAIGFNKIGNQLRIFKQNRLNCFMFFKCSKQRDEGCFKGAMEIGKNGGLSDSNSITNVNTGQNNRNSNNNKKIISNNNNNNSNKNGKKLNKKSQQSPNMENGKNKKGKRGGKGKRRNINNYEKFNSNNNSSSSSSNNNNNNSISNLKQLQIYEPVEPNRRHNSFPNQQMSSKQQRKLPRPVRHSHHRNHHQQHTNEDKIAQIFENFKK